jgi:hypothetical protein
MVVLLKIKFIKIVALVSDVPIGGKAQSILKLKIYATTMPFYQRD